MLNQSNPKIIGASQARANFYQLVRQAAVGSAPIIQLRGEKPVVMLDLEEYQSLLETAEILAIPGAAEEIHVAKKQARKKEGISLDELEKRMEQE